jgi:hypothetical protein
MGKEYHTNCPSSTMLQAAVDAVKLRGLRAFETGKSADVQHM